MKNYLDGLAKKYETKSFIKNDPLQFPYRFSEKRDIEISALISSCMAYGRREKIIEALEKIHTIMGDSPYEFIKNFDFDKNELEGFVYRMTKAKDIELLFFALKGALNDYNSLEELFLEGFNGNMKLALEYFVHKLRHYANDKFKVGDDFRGFHYLMPSSCKNSACKRLNLFLRWMVREGEVDMGIWKKIPKSALIIPLDTHVARISRELDFTERKLDNWQTAWEITENLKKFCPEDPVRYDFAIFGRGVNNKPFDNLLKSVIT